MGYIGLWLNDCSRTTSKLELPLSVFKSVVSYVIVFVIPLTTTFK
ncbi:hypothetical protein NWE60_06445 [Mycoplasmopsis felis]|nr:hypothetical protein [Mycoplasmopsis felis]WAM01002.1 hypothetical protein NWE60_06445 [Mycoplasmopsis felis]